MKNKIIVVFVLLSIAIYPLLKLKTYIEVRQIFEYSSWDTLDQLELVPTVYSLPKQLQTDTTRISYKNLVFILPNEIVKDTILDQSKHILFDNNSRLVIIDNSDNEALDFYDEFRQTDQFKTFFIENNISSNYELRNYIAKLRPSQISWLAPNWEILIKYTLLRTKQLSWVTGQEEGFINIESNQLKWFIYGPQASNSTFFIEGFDRNDQTLTIFAKGFDQKTILEILNRAYKAR